MRKLSKRQNENLKKIKNEADLVIIETTESDYVYESAGASVRIPTYRSVYVLRKLQKSVSVEYTLKLDPGGILPAWAVNLAAVKGPVKTMEALEELLQSGQY